MINVIETQKQALIVELQGIHKAQASYQQHLTDLTVRSTQIAGALQELTKLQATISEISSDPKEIGGKVD